MKLHAIHTLAALALLALTPCLNAGGEEQEARISLKSCPLPVQKTMLAQAKAEHGRIIEITREKEDGCTVYEAEIKTARGALIEIEVAPDGTLLEKETEDAPNSGRPRR
jgi:uncharacterized membrane protein YkoI